MTRNHITLAVLGVFAMPALGQQTNVQVYGTIDMGISHLGSGTTSHDVYASPRSRTAIDSGLYTSNRLGFRGEEDLGNGLRGFFEIETAFVGDTRSALDGNRHAFLGLAGDFGQLSIGRQLNPTRHFIGRMDPFNNDSYAAAENFYTVQSRLDNSVIYRSPDFNGFSVDVAYSRNIEGDEETRFSGEDRSDERMWAIVPTYEHGPLTLGLSYQRTDAGDASWVSLYNIEQGVAPDYNGYRQWDIGAAYDFGPVEVSALHGRKRFDLSNQSDIEIRQWLLGASMPVSEAGMLMASYARNTIENDLRGEKWSIGYDHALSARTSLYAVYAHVNTNSDGEGFYDAARIGPRHEFDDEDSLVNSGAYESAFAMGVRHRF